MGQWVLSTGKLNIGEEYRVFDDIACEFSNLVLTDDNIGSISNITPFGVGVGIGTPLRKLVWEKDIRFSISLGSGLSFIVTMGDIEAVFTLEYGTPPQGSFRLSCGGNYVKLLLECCEASRGEGYPLHLYMGDECLMNISPVGYCRECDTYAVLCSYRGVFGRAVIVLYLHKGIFVGFSCSEHNVGKSDWFSARESITPDLARLNMVRGIRLQGGVK